MPLTLFERGDDWIRLFRGDMLSFARNLRKFVITPAQLSAGLTPVTLVPAQPGYILVPTTISFNKPKGASWTTAGVTGLSVTWGGVVAGAVQTGNVAAALGTTDPTTYLVLNNGPLLGAVYSGLSIPLGGELGVALDFRTNGAAPALSSGTVLNNAALIILMEFMAVPNELSAF